MATYFTADHASDLSEYDSTTGQVLWSPIGGHNGGGSLRADARSAAAYATADLGAIGDTLYVRARIAAALGCVGAVLRGRTAGGLTCWQLRTVWPTAWSMELRLDVLDNAGATHTYELVPPLINRGVLWAELMIVTGAGAGEAQAWLGGELELATQFLPPNSDRVARYLDVGLVAASAEEVCNVDAVVAADALSGPETWTPAAGPTWTEHGRTYETWTAYGEPTGGWDEFCEPATGLTIERLRIVRGCRTRVQLADTAGRIVLDLPEGQGPWSRDEPLIAQAVRFSSIAEPSHVRAVVVRRT